MLKRKKEVLMGGISLHDRPPSVLREPSVRSPINIRLGKELYLHDSELCKPMMITGEMGSGKSRAIMEICRQLDAQRQPDDLLVIFCAKPELLEAFYQPGDVVISYDAEDPACIHNIFRELGGPDVTTGHARVILREFIGTITAPFYRNTKESFFIDAASDLLENLILTLREDAMADGTWEKLSNKYLLDTLDELSQFVDVVNDAGEKEQRMGWELAVREKEMLRHCSVYIGNTLFPSDLCLSVLAQLTAIVTRTFVGSFAGEGHFSTADAMRGGRLFLVCDYARSSSSSAPLITTILNRILQLSLDNQREKERRRTYVVLDEMALLEKLRLAEPTSYGRAAGMRLFMCLQSVTLLKEHYSPAEAERILSLAPNMLCFHTTCPVTREHVARRSGTHYISVNDDYGTRLQINREPVITDEDYSLIARPGDAFCLVGSQEPFILHGYKEDLYEK